MLSVRFRTKRIAFGATAGVVTSMGLIVGLGAADAGTRTIVSALLIAAIADNLTDSLGIHIYQESERLDKADAFAGTLTNFAARLVLCATFVVLVAALPRPAATALALIWGLVVLGTLTWMLARERGVAPAPEVVKHLAVAVAVIAASRLIGQWIGLRFA